MKKQSIKLRYGILAFILTLTNACAPETSIIPEGGDAEDIACNNNAIVDSIDIRVLKVVHRWEDISTSYEYWKESEFTYDYDTNGRLSRVHVQDIMGNSYFYFHTEYSNNQVKLILDGGKHPYSWNGSTIIYRNNKVENIIVDQPNFFSTSANNYLARMNIGRTQCELNSVILDNTFVDEKIVAPNAPELKWMSYHPLNTRVLTYNSNGLPDRLETVKGINEIGYEDLKGSALEYWDTIPYEKSWASIESYYGPDVFNDLLDKFGVKSSYNPFFGGSRDAATLLNTMLVPGPVEFAFKYDEAADVPAKLKRLVNEELLHLNEYGETNWQTQILLNNAGLRGFNVDAFFINESGSGNWTVSFGLPQYYILEDKSTHMVSKRTTSFYQLNTSGRKELLKTTVEDFPYIHDTVAKTLEINNMRIWYEFVK